MMPYLCLIFKIIFIVVQLIYNVVLVSIVQQSDSIIHIHTSTPFKNNPFNLVILNGYWGRMWMEANTLFKYCFLNYVTTTSERFPFLCPISNS